MPHKKINDGAAMDIMRRATDFFSCMLAVIVIAPVMIVVALLVRIILGRPVTFIQDRIGMGGKTFQLIKFRSMSDARDEHGRLLDDASRTTPFGRLLRRSRLDELPELWNILKGEMAIIGPRPLLPETIKAMGADGMRRCAVRPGLTGWAQICGNSQLSNEDKLALDLWYIEHRSLRLDIVIVIKSLQLMLFGERIDYPKLKLARHKTDKAD
jgi:lipopolysaccharide/colanic/teichoic acid biosynthesis glycosyltransferase